MTTTSNLSSLLKVFYVEDKLHKQFNQKSVLYDKLWKKWQTDASGKSYTYGVLAGGLANAGSGYAESGTFPASDYVNVANAVVPNTRIATPVELSGDVIRAAKGPNKGAFASAARLTIEQATMSTMHAINRQLHGDGRDALAFWTATDTTSGTNVDDGQGNAFPIHLPKSGTVTCDLIDTDNTTVNGNDIVVTRGAAGASSVAITWTGTVSAGDDGDYLVHKDTLGKQMMGIRGVISASDPPLLSGGLHGFTVASNPYWTSQVFAAGSAGANADLTLTLMQQPLSAIDTESDFSQADVKFLLTNRTVFNKYVDIATAAKYHFNTMTLDGGQTAVTFNDKPLVLDPQCQENVIWYIVPESMAVLTSSGGVTWYTAPDGSGQQWFPKTGGATQSYADAWQTFQIFYGNLACKVRSANAVLQYVA